MIEPYRPLHERIAERLRSSLMNAPDESLPSIPQMARQYGVSGKTMWKAVSLLKREGLLTCRRGSRVAVTSVRRYEETTLGYRRDSSAGQLFEKLRDRIGDGTYAAGSTLPKTHYFVLTEHVSQATVLKALRLLVSHGLVHRRGRSWIVGPGENERTEKVRVGQGPRPTVVVLVKDLAEWRKVSTEAPFSPFAGCFCNEIERHGIHYRVAVASPRRGEGIFAAGRPAIRKLVDASEAPYLGTLVIAGSKQDNIPDLEEWLSWLRKMNRPVVLFDRQDILGKLGREEGDTLFYRCRSDESVLVKPAITTLHDLGHRRVGVPGWIGSRSYFKWFPIRRSHIIDTAKRCTPPVQVFTAPNPSPAISQSYHYRSLKRLTSTLFPRTTALPSRAMLVRAMGGMEQLLREHHVTALVGMNDDLALKYYLHLVQQGTAVPEQVSLISFDNQERFRAFPISTIDPGFDNLGYRAAHIFIGDIPVKPGRRGSITGSPRLLDRGSLGPPLRLESVPRGRVAQANPARVTPAGRGDINF